MSAFTGYARPLRNQKTFCQTLSDSKRPKMDAGNKELFLSLLRPLNVLGFVVLG